VCDKFALKVRLIFPLFLATAKVKNAPIDDIDVVALSENFPAVPYANSQGRVP
jgi:hypothetical protein